MDKATYNFKKIFRLHIRVGLLVTLVAFILGFVFIPEFGTKPYQPRVQNVIRIDEILSPVNVVRIPPPPKLRLPVEAKNDNEVEEETIPVTIFTGEEKVPVVGFEPPPFVAYETPPMPLNLDKVRFDYPGVFQIEGTVFLELWIDEEGNVRNVILSKSLHPVFDKVAIDGAKKLKFSPAIQRDKPVAVRYSFPVRFKLE